MGLIRTLLLIINLNPTSTIQLLCIMETNNNFKVLKNASLASYLLISTQASSIDD